jgi:hypothetical protein
MLSVDPPIPLISFEEPDPSDPIDESGLVTQALVRAEGRDGAFELTFVWIALISGACVTRLSGRFVVARSKRARAP